MVLLLLSGMFLIVLPWTVRNYAVFNDVVFFKSPFGYNLLKGIGEAEVFPAEQQSAIEAQLKGLNEAEQQGLIAADVVLWIRQHPLIFLSKLPEHFLDYWWEVDRYKQDSSLRFLLGRRLPYALLLLLSVPLIIVKTVKFITGRSKSEDRVLFNVPIILLLSFTLVYTVFGAWNMRFHFPVEMFMFIFLAASIQVLHAIFVKKRLAETV
jgi:hypothetical protein